MRQVHWRMWIPITVLVLSSGCASSGSRYTPIFDYSPPQQAQPAAANVTFAVVGATFPGSTSTLFSQFAQNISQDFFEILTSRGYTVRGPFQTYDDITFPDKKGSDLILMPELQINWDASGLRWEPSLGAALFGKSAYSGEGNLVLTGRINLVVAESLSREKMWTKSVDIPPLTVRIDETAAYGMPDVPIQQLLESETAVYNPVAKALEMQYKKILDRANQYLDPEEMQIVKKQAQEIRNKKVY
jgi:hypothetical protein